MDQTYQLKTALPIAQATVYIYLYIYFLSSLSGVLDWYEFGIARSRVNLRTKEQKVNERKREKEWIEQESNLIASSLSADDI
jgi:hypothetical protein